jgi:CPA1 family monovalent cation:H+ antiporter
MGTENTVVVLFCVATAIAIIARRLRVPYSVALVLAGLGLGWLHLVDPPRLTRDLLFTFFLPGLLFEAAFHIDLGALRGLWRSVATLAVPGVVLSIALTAAIVLLGSAMGLVAPIAVWNALIFGALVAATDPVAVTALFREVGAPARLATLVEAESLFNDGTGVVFLSLVLALATAAGTSVLGVIPSFFLVAGGGVVAGVLVGYGVTRIIRRVDDSMIEIALTMIAALGSFVLADALHVSGVLATVTAGMMCARHDSETGMTAESRQAAEGFWQYVGFALNSIVFLLIGLEVQASRLAADWTDILLGFAAMTLARVALVGLLHLGFRRSSEAIPGGWSVILAWGGLRGALSMVLALSLPNDLPGRDRLVSAAVGVVIASLLIQGLTMPAVVRRVLAVDRSLT